MNLKNNKIYINITNHERNLFDVFIPHIAYAFNLLV